MFGLAAGINKELLAEIEKRNPEGIYSAEKLIEKINERKGEFIFFTVSAGEGYLGPVGGPFILISPQDQISVDTPIDGFEISCKKYSHGRKEDRFIKDLFWGSKACFLDEKLAKKYLEDIHSHRDSLIEVI